MSENTGNESSGAVGLLDEFLTVERVRQEPERRMPDGSMNDLKSMSLIGGKTRTGRKSIFEDGVSGVLRERIC